MYPTTKLNRCETINDPACVPGGSGTGVPAGGPQLPGPRGHPAVRDPGGASAAVRLSHHLLPVQHPASGAQIHPQSRVHSGAVHTLSLSLSSRLPLAYEAFAERRYFSTGGLNDLRDHRVLRPPTPWVHSATRSDTTQSQRRCKQPSANLIMSCVWRSGNIQTDSTGRKSNELV